LEVAFSALGIISLFAVIDIETTGGKYNEEGITEIAIYQFDGHKITDTFISLINPEKAIQPFVVKLTGIHSKMLRNAPKFFEVAKRIVNITEDCIVVAHNANFDYRILRTEFNRLGFDYKRKTLCTLELSKKLLPGKDSYSLGKLTKSLGIPITDRHRAYGDALATVKLLQILLEKDTHKKILKVLVKELKPKSKKEKHINIIDSLPSETGVYYIHNRNDEIIYIGKSTNIKKRMTTHLTQDLKKDVLIQKHIKKVSYALTGSEIIALLKEQNEIKENQPLLNQSRKQRSFPFGVKTVSVDGFLQLVIESPQSKNDYIAVFKNKANAKKQLLKWVSEYDLCLNKTVLKNGRSHCDRLELSDCKGACVGKESGKTYNERVRKLMDDVSYPYENFLIIDKGRNTGEYSFILVQNNVFQGYGYYSLNFQLTAEKIQSRLISIENNQDTKHIIKHAITHKKQLKLLPLDSFSSIEEAQKEGV